MNNDIESFYKPEFLEKIVKLGLLNYPIEKCIFILGIPENEKQSFIEKFNDPNNIIYQKYQTGIALADFQIDTRLYSLAVSGDLKAIQEFEKRRNHYKNF